MADELQEAPAELNVSGMADHASDLCQCPHCAPEVFKGKTAGVDFEATQPPHMCQRCFAGVCCTLIETPAEESAAEEAPATAEVPAE